MTTPLKLVQPVKSERPRDIYAADKALAASINWSAVHIAADRRRPIYLPNSKRWGWK